jgi:hypothetical protein
MVENVEGWVIHICASGLEKLYVWHDRNWPAFAYHHTDGRTYWLIYGPPELSNVEGDGTPSGLTIAPPEFQHIRPQ